MMLEVDMIGKMDGIIKTAQETIIKANAAGSDWLARAAQKEIVWARSEKKRVLEKMMRENG